MTAQILAFPSRAARENAGFRHCGTIHVWMHGPGQFEIGHESASGGSWGWFAHFPTAAQAVAGAHALNAREMNGECEVFVPNDVLALLPGGAA